MDADRKLGRYSKSTQARWDRWGFESIHASYSRTYSVLCTWYVVLRVYEYQSQSHDNSYTVELYHYGGNADSLTTRVYIDYTVYEKAAERTINNCVRPRTVMLLQQYRSYSTKEGAFKQGNCDICWFRVMEERLLQLYCAVDIAGCWYSYLASCNVRNTLFWPIPASIINRRFCDLTWYR